LESYSEHLPVNRRQKSRVVGAISVKKAAQRYIDTAKEMGLVIVLGREWQTTKTGHLLATVPSNPNPFGLSMPQRFILFDVLARADYLYLSSLVRLILANDRADDPDHFKKEVISQIEISSKKSTNTDEIRGLRKIRESIDNWEDPDRYFREQIKAPRLEWLLDLGLLTRWNQRANYFTLRPGTANFFSKPNPDDKYFDENYASLFYDCFKGDLPPSKRWEDVSRARRSLLLKKQLEYAVDIFKSASIDKISASQFLKFAVCMLLVEEGIIASTLQVERALIDLTAQSSKYRYVRMVSDIDIGYIVKKKI
jgi:hypothetical protein